MRTPRRGAAHGPVAESTPAPDLPPLAEPVRGAIAFHDVGFAYPGAAHPVLHRVRLDIAPGTLLAVTGPSGAGKSTLGKLLLRVYEPSEGRILLDGRDIAHLPVDEVRRHITLLLQDSMLFDGTVKENIVYGRPDATDEEVVAAAMAADAHDFVDALPSGYDTPVGKRGSHLSGGQCRRIALARAMLRTAPVLILDEPTAGLDDASAARIMAPLRRLTAGRTTLLITHDLRLTAQANLVLHLTDAAATLTTGPLSATPTAAEHDAA